MIHKMAIQDIRSLDEGNLVQAYRSLWIDCDHRLHELEEVLIANVYGSVLRQWLPLHARVRHRGIVHSSCELTI